MITYIRIIRRWPVYHWSIPRTPGLREYTLYLNGNTWTRHARV